MVVGFVIQTRVWQWCKTNNINLLVRNLSLSYLLTSMLDDLQNYLVRISRTDIESSERARSKREKGKMNGEERRERGEGEGKCQAMAPEALEALEAPVGETCRTESWRPEAREWDGVAEK